MYKVMNQGLIIYRVSWEVYDDEGCYETLYGDWVFSLETAQKMRNNLMEVKKRQKNLIHINDIEQDFVTCSKEEVENLVNKMFPLIED